MSELIVLATKTETGAQEVAETIKQLQSRSSSSSRTQRSRSAGRTARSRSSRRTAWWALARWAAPSGAY
jgi:hypothetical protein